MTTKHIYKLPLLTLLVSAGLLTACSSDDDNTVGEDSQSPTEATRLITLEVNEHPLIDTSAQSRDGLTRSDIITTASLTQFSMTAVYSTEYQSEITQKYGVEKKTDAGDETTYWVLDPNTWPGGADNNENTKFYAYNGGTFNYNNGNVYLNYTIPENASDHLDLLVAKNEVAYNSSNQVGKVSLTFDHACAAVTFSIQMTKTLADSLGNNELTVNSIKLCNVNNTGKYYFKTNSWAEVGGNTFYTLDNRLGFVVTTTKENLTSKYLFVIPQTRAADGTTGTYLEINYTVTGKDPQDANIALAPNWEAGYKYPILIRLGTKQINYK